MKEADIRPAELVEKYLELSHQDADLLFESAEFSSYCCEACDGIPLKPAFKKRGYVYSECSDCKSVFLDPRPTLKSFASLYENSKSSRFWSEVFFPSIAEKRRISVFKPRVKSIGRELRLGKDYDGTIADVGAGYGIFLEEFQKEFPNSNPIAIEPSHSLSAKCIHKGLQTFTCMLEDVESLNESCDIATSFEVLEHVHSPLEFLRSLSEIIKPGGWLVCTTLTLSGFDLMLLRENSMQISPPHHINFFTIDGLRNIFTQAGFEDIRIETPGQLDLEILSKSKLYQSYDGLFQTFFDSILKDENKSAAFQAFLSENQLSSHVRVIARRVA